MPKCASCNSRVSANDDVCPVCGEEMSPRAVVRKSNRGKKSSKKKAPDGPNMKVIGGVLGGLAVVAIIVLIIIMTRKPEQDAVAAAPPPQAAPAPVPGAPPVVAPAPVQAQQSPTEEELSLRRFEEKVRAMSNLQQIGLATHNFHDTFNQFPPEIIAKNPNPAQGMSWMTGLLPMVSQPAIYQMIAKEEAWNSPTNQRANANVIPEFLHRPGFDERDANGFGMSHYAGNVHVFGTGKKMGLRDISDGTSNTFMAGSVATGYKPWADPSNLRDLKNGVTGGPNGFGMPHEGIALLLMADGSVREISGSTAPQLLEGLSLPADGKTSGF